MALPAQPTQAFMDERALRRLVFTVIGVLTVLFGGSVLLYARHGRALLDRLETIEPTTVLMRGMELERLGRGEEAMACYQRALDLGLSWPGSVANCTKRLERLRAERKGAEP